MQLINFWLSLVNSKPNKLSHIMYNLLRAETNSGIYEHKWIKHMQKILQEAGAQMSGLRKRLIIPTLSKPA